MTGRFIHRLSLTATLALSALMAPALAQAETIAIINAHILTPGPVGDVAQGSIIIKNGIIEVAGATSTAPADARIIDAKGGYVTPGLVAVNTTLGLSEVNSVRGTVDSRAHNTGISAGFDVQYALNPDSTLIPIARLGGITRAVVMPGYDNQDEDRQIPFGGQPAMISLGQGVSMLFKPRLGVVLEMNEAGADRAGGSRAAEFIQLRTLFTDVRKARSGKAYAGEGGDLSRTDIEALLPVVEGKIPLIITAHRASDIRQALRLAQELGIRIILDGADEGWRVAGEIAAARVPVMLNPTSNIPTRFELMGATLHNAALLQKAGVDIAISGNDGGHRVRDMRYNAGIAVSRGLPHAAAIEAITLAPARIFGVDDRLGSIAPGKIADIVIWNGDPLEPLSQPQMILVEGREQPLTSRATQLRDRYLK